MDYPVTVRIFLSSPGDVIAERKIAYETIERFTDNYPEFKPKFRLQPVGWDRQGAYVPMEANYDPQSVIDRRIPRSSDCDIVLILFWSRMGTLMNPNQYVKEEKYQYEVALGEEKHWFFSGTEWEYVAAMKQAAIDNHPRIYVFRRNSPMEFIPSDSNLQEKIQQITRVNHFFSQFGNAAKPYLTGSYDKYETVEEFKGKLNGTLKIVLDEFLKNPPTALSNRPSGEHSLYLEPWVGSPFPGLRPFDEHDERIFFGRDKDLAELINQVVEHKFTAIVGASGAGKSSIVRAGLIPQLKRNAIQKPKKDYVDLEDTGQEWEIRSQDWAIVKMKPGELEVEGFHTPFDAFQKTLVAAFPDSGASYFKEQFEPMLLQLVRANTAANLDAAGRNAIFESGLRDFKNELEKFIADTLQKMPLTCEILLLVDQFEEVFTIVDDPTVRNAFILFIEQLAACHRCRVIVTMRADFFHYCVDYPELAGLLRTGSFTLAPPGLGSLHEMIYKPAEVANLKFEKDLAEKILVDTDENSGGLPLMAYLLDQMYERCKKQGYLTRKTYEALGGVAGAIGKKAEQIMDDLRKDGQDVSDKLHFIFWELVEVNKEGAPTRRRADKSKISTDPEMAKLVENLIHARLLVTNAFGIKEERNEIVEVAHEALLREWKELKVWIDTTKDDFLIRKKVEDAAAEWMNQGRLSRLLWSHEQLAPFYQVMHRFKYQLDDFEPHIQEFIKPEMDRLMEELQTNSTSHQRRQEIGNRIWQLGDTRFGVGNDEHDIPQIYWCKVMAPAGKVLLDGISHSFDVKSFYIAKYPITLTQFKAFIEAPDGFKNEVLWDSLGKKPYNHGINPQTPEIGNHPAVWISWYQAIVFCRWLSMKLGFEVRVPFEWEWQHAATGGNEQFCYPWGPEWDPNACNSLEAGINNIVAVGLYPKGASPVGAEDMAGNMFEWCLNNYENVSDQIDFLDTTNKTTRGGAYFVPRPLMEKMSPKDAVKTTTRLGDDPSGPAERKVRVTLRLVADYVPDKYLHISEQTSLQ